MSHFWHDMQCLLPAIFPCRALDVFDAFFSNDLVLMNNEDYVTRHVHRQEDGHIAEVQLELHCCKSNPGVTPHIFFPVIQILKFLVFRIKNSL